MNVLAFDGRTGASGDMILAALLDAGADPAALEPVADALELEYRIDETIECGISATTVDVYLTGDRSTESVDRDPRTRSDEEAAGHEYGRDSADRNDGRESGGHGHERDSADRNDGHDSDGHDHTHAHRDDGHQDHARAHADVPAEGHGPHRRYLEVLEVVEGMDLPSPVERDALAIFEVLGEAEAAVHGEPVAEIHFHEVGADDAIADVVGAAALVHDLDPDRVVTTPLATGDGAVSTSHGEYPVPTPAVVEIAGRADWTLQGGPVDRELLTPTGAAILAHFADGVESLPALDLETSGYGAGGYDLDPHPNVLRVLVGDGGGGGELIRDDITVLETNLDDATPEILGGLQETLADAGARDVSILPVTMKKSRPGHLVKVICKPEDRERVARTLAEETGTLGVREAGATHRWIADREFQTVELEIEGETYEVTVKVATDADGEVYDVSAEYEDGKAVARETGLATREVIRRAEDQAIGDLTN